MPNEALDDAMQSIDVNPGLIPGNTDADAVLNRLEQRISSKGSSEQEPKLPKKTEKGEEVSAPTTESEVSEDEQELEQEETEETEDEETDSEEESEEKETESEESEEEYLELSPDQLAEVLGVPEDNVQVSEEGKLSFRTKVDGKEAFVPLEDLTTSYQLEKHLRNKSTEDAAKRREFEEKVQAETAKIQETVTDATALVHVLEQQFANAYSQEDMARLRQENPAEWSAKNQEIQQMQQFIDGAKQQLRGTIQQQQAKAQEAQQNQMKTYLDKQTELLMAADSIPSEWKTDPQKAVQGMEALHKVAKDAYGFTDAEIKKITDHRIYLLLQDASKGRALKDTTPLEHRLRKTPKIVKPSAKQTQDGAAKKKARLRKQKRTIQKSGGSVGSIAAALEDRINL